jgi:hypothetical protein
VQLKGNIKEFIDKHKTAEDALNNYFTIMKEVDFANFNETRIVLNAVDTFVLLNVSINRLLRVCYGTLRCQKHL